MSCSPLARLSRLSSFALTFENWSTASSAEFATNPAWCVTTSRFAEVRFPESCRTHNASSKSAQTPTSVPEWTQNSTWDRLRPIFWEFCAVCSALKTARVCNQQTKWIRSKTSAVSTCSFSYTSGSCFVKETRNIAKSSLFSQAGYSEFETRFETSSAPSSVSGRSSRQFAPASGLLSFG